MPSNSRMKDRPARCQQPLGTRAMSAYRLGLIVNPIAGMGGAAGLKGTDRDLAEKARALGATPLAGRRAAAALSQLADLGDRLVVFTCSGMMGLEAARASGLPAQVASVVPDGATSAADTRAAALRILERHPHLLLFAGGDGTARDLLQALGQRLPMLGVPCGVKMHSATFAATPRAAGEVVRRYLLAADREALLRDAEILDRETSAEASGRLSPKLHGMVRTPCLSFLVPGAKSSAGPSEQADLQSAVRRAVALAGDRRITLIGPGSTMQRVKRGLGFEGTPLGVDAAIEGRCLAKDLGERGILDLLRDRPARILLSVVGGQGFLFGRGNQQFSPRVIRAVGLDRIFVLASLEKLAALPQQCLLVDTGDERLDERLAGFREVILSGRRTVLMPVRNAGREAP